MRIHDIRARLNALGAQPLHADRVLRDWVRVMDHDRGRRRPDDFLPKPVRAALPQLDAELDALARVVSAHPAGDGAASLLVGLADGQAVESVLLPRDGVCVSSQVGCAVGCTFCITGRDGLLRQVTIGEIVRRPVPAGRRARVARTGAP